jgi:glutamate N-acetyltransferase / amino-acid N-acetyltransferase
LSANGSEAAAKAIMTSDTFHKEIAVELQLGGKSVRIGGIAKGAGMINPEMATMLCLITTDASISKRDLQKMTSDSVEQSFNCITVDGDMSTNDTAICLANGQAGIAPIEQDNEVYERFSDGLKFVTRQLARMIVEDGEGVTKFVEVHVKGAATYQDARKAAEAVANSALVKCAWFGEDPNWGRVMAAVGYSSAKVREEMIDIFFNGVVAAQHGMASSTPQETLKEVLGNKKFTVTIDLHLGSAEYKVFTTDLTPEYVNFNMGE